MENFQERAFAFIEANKGTPITYEGETFTNDNWGFEAPPSEYTVNGRPLTEVIIEWENEMNQMPKLEPGMMFEQLLSGQTPRIYMYINDDWCIDLENDINYNHSLSSRSPISKVWPYRKGNIKMLMCHVEATDPIWTRETDEERELKDLISSLKQNLDDASERLQALQNG